MSTSLYERLADQLAGQIQDGLYREGEKLPSIRQLSRQQTVSISTVQQAYGLLEDRCLVEARHKSGYYVRASRPPGSEGPLSRAPREGAGILDEQFDSPRAVSVHELADRVMHRCENPDLVNLGTAYPHPELLPVAKLGKIMARLVRENMSAALTARFSPGLPQLRRQIAKWMNQIGCDVRPEEVVVTNGCQEALQLCLRSITRPGDTIAIESPCFVGLLEAIEACGLSAVEIPSDGRGGLSTAALELALERWPIRAVAAVTSFSNPGGAHMPVATRRDLVRMLAARQIPMVEDDVYGDLAHDGQRWAPAKAEDREGLVLYCSSISKTIAPGLRVGWVSPGRYQARLESLKSFTNVTASTIAQATVAEFLTTGAHHRHLRQLRERLAQHCRSYRATILEHFPNGTEVSSPQGGYLLWIRLPGQVDGTRLHELAYAQGIGIMPGTIFSSQAKFQNYIRVSCARPFCPAVKQAIVTLAGLVQEMRVVPR